MNVLAVCNQKGGVGKTTLAINLGAALADTGRRVLLVDLDPQGHATEGTGLQELYLTNGPNLYDCLLAKKPIALADIIRPHPIESYHVIPSNYQMMLAEQALYMARNREHRLRGLLPALEGRFDWAVIDCPPALGNLTDNALNAARQVVVPIQAEATSVRALELLFDQIESLERGLSICIEVLAVVPNLVQDSALSKRILADLRAHIPQVVPFEIRKRVLLQEAWSQGCSVFGLKPQGSAQAKTREELVDLYRELAGIVTNRSVAAVA